MHVGKIATLSCDKYRADRLICIPEDICLISFTEIIGGKQNKTNSPVVPVTALLPSTCQTRSVLSTAVGKASEAALRTRSLA